VRSSAAVVLNSYKRDYFVSGDGITRITLDYDLKAWDQRMYPKPNMRIQVPLLNVMVIEFKRDIKGAKEFADILAQFPLRVTNYSKYVESLNTILGW
ncbi:MAG: VTC domain-containing protein, partial [Bacteroidales bacterium]|nr:VTC domain-containing protein [Bacteroidales bacterium]